MKVKIMYGVGDLEEDFNSFSRMVNVIKVKVVKCSNRITYHIFYREKHESKHY